MATVSLLYLMFMTCFGPMSIQEISAQEFIIPDSKCMGESTPMEDIHFRSVVFSILHQKQLQIQETNFGLRYVPGISKYGGILFTSCYFASHMYHLMDIRLFNEFIQYFICNFRYQFALAIQIFDPQMLTKYQRSWEKNLGETNTI